MSATARLWAKLGNETETRCFRLPIGGLLEIKERTGIDPAAVIDKLVGDDVSDDELFDLKGYAESCQLVADVIEIALAWGGTPRQEARQLVNLHCIAPNRHLGSSSELPLALSVLVAATSPDKDEPFPVAKVQPNAPVEDDKSFKFAPFYNLAGRLGLSPNELMNLSIWELAHFQQGWKEANGVADAGLTKEEVDNISKALDEFEPIYETHEVDDEE